MLRKLAIEKYTNPDDIAVENFQKYLKIPTAQPNVSYEAVVRFIKQQGKDLMLEYRIIEIEKKKPIIVLTRRGSKPELASIMLNSHMDVRPVNPAMWTHKPFDAEIDMHGNIYGRGAQDMKSVGIQYLEAVRRLNTKKRRLRRDIHITFVPDDSSLGTTECMKKFVMSHTFRHLNVGLALDEGIPSSTSTFFVCNGDRYQWRMEFGLSGNEGCVYGLAENTATEKLKRLLDNFLTFRQTQVTKLKQVNKPHVGDVTAINLTSIQGGEDFFDCAPQIKVTFDFQVSRTVDPVAFEAQIKKWVLDSGEGIQVKWINKGRPAPLTAIDDTNFFWMAMKEEFDNMKLNYRITSFPTASNARFCRELGIPVIGFTPIINTPPRFNSQDEFLNKQVFLKGIEIYEGIIYALSNVK